MLASAAAATTWSTSAEMDTAMEALVDYTTTWDDADTVNMISISSSDIGSASDAVVFQSYS
jgi:hypothetical protein